MLFDPAAPMKQGLLDQLGGLTKGVEQ